MTYLSFSPILRILLLACLVPCFTTWAATIDLNFSLGKVLSPVGTPPVNQPLAGTAVRLGSFTGYTDGLGAGFFSGKDYATLFSSFTPLSVVVATPPNPEVLASGGSAGTFFSSYESNLAAGTRLFAWFWTTPTPTVASDWAVISGTIGGTGAFDEVWLAPSPTALDVQNIEVGVISNVIFAESALNNSLVANTTLLPEGANLVIPEPSSMSLVIMGLASALAFRRKRALLTKEDSK